MDNFARDKDGRILRDRYGRPVQRRPQSSQPRERRFAPPPGGQPRGRTGGRHAGPSGNQAAPRNPQRPPERASHPNQRFAQRPGERPRPSVSRYDQPRRAAQPNVDPRARHRRPDRADSRPAQHRQPSFEEQKRAYYREHPEALRTNERIPRYAAPAPAVQPQRPYEQGGGRRYASAPRPAATPPPRRAPWRDLRVPRVGCGNMLRWAAAIMVTLLIVTLFWTDTKFERVEAMPAQHISNTAGTNWLLVGSDSREGLTEEQNHELMTGGDVGGNRTDTIMVLHVPLIGKPTLLSLPRDSYVEIPGYGMDKINAAFSYGGPPLLIETVENSTGLKIDHYTEIGFGGFAAAVDAVGGVNVCVDEPIHDDVINFHIEAGCHDFNGAQGLSFVRTRATAQGDIDRAGRQRQFLAALAKKVASPTTVLNPFRTFPLISGVAGALTVDKGDHTWHMLWAALHMLSGFDTEVVPIGGMDFTDAGSVILWDEVQSEQLFDSLR